MIRKRRMLLTKLLPSATLLDVSDGPVVSECCAVEVAPGVSTLLDAKVALALTRGGGLGWAQTQMASVRALRGGVSRRALRNVA